VIRSIAKSAALGLLLAAASDAHAAMLVDDFLTGTPLESGGGRAPPTRVEIPAPPPPLVTGEVATPRFRVRFTERSEGVAQTLAGRVEHVRDSFRDVLGRDWPGITEVRVGMGREEMRQLAPGAEPVPRWAEALAYPERNLILLDARTLVQPTGEVTLRHELSHVALGQLAPSWPHWFQEGIAMYLTGDRFSITQYAAMFRAVTNDRLFDFQDLAESWPQQPQDVEIAYAQSVVFVAHLVDRFGSQRLGELVDHVRAGAPFEVAFARAFQTSVGVEQRVWEEELPRRYSWVPIVTGGSVFWGVAALLTVAAWVRRSRVQSLRRAEMRAQEAAEDAAAKLAAGARFEDPTSAAQDRGWAGWRPERADVEDAASDEDSSPTSRSSKDEDLPAVADGSEQTHLPRRVLH
jgi:hypothetical protein